MHGKILHVVSYGEDGSIGVSETDPFENYKKAVSERQPVCSCCLPHLDAVRIYDDD